MNCRALRPIFRVNVVSERVFVDNASNLRAQRDPLKERIVSRPRTRHGMDEIVGIEAYVVSGIALNVIEAWRGTRNSQRRLNRRAARRERERAGYYTEEHSICSQLDGFARRSGCRSSRAFVRVSSLSSYRPPLRLSSHLRAEIAVSLRHLREISR